MLTKTIHYCQVIIRVFVGKYNESQIEKVPDQETYGLFSEQSVWTGPTCHQDEETSYTILIYLIDGVKN